MFSFYRKKRKKIKEKIIEDEENNRILDHLKKEATATQKEYKYDQEIDTDMNTKSMDIGRI